MYLRGMCAHNVPHINNHALFLENELFMQVNASGLLRFFLRVLFLQIQRSGSNLVFD